VRWNGGEHSYLVEGCNYGWAIWYHEKDNCERDCVHVNTGRNWLRRNGTALPCNCNDKAY
jgi:hypothetical protein